MGSDGKQAVFGDGWHVDKRISVGHILTTVTVLIGLIAWSLKIEGRVDLADVRITNNENAIREVRAATAVQYNEIIRRLERIDQNSSAHLEMHAGEKR